RPHTSRHALPSVKHLAQKKPRLAIRARERNRVDVGAMEGVMDFVMDKGIDKAADHEGLMTTEEAKELADNSRPVPPFSLTATDPSDVYPLHGIIPETEWKSLTVSALYEAGSAHNRKQILPFRGSDWVNTRLESIMQQTEKDKKRSLPRTTPQLDLLLLSHMLALCLRIDNYAADHALITRDLSLATEKITALDALSDEKDAKIKTFSKEYIAKVTSSAVDTPNSIKGADVEMTEMTVEETIDMESARARTMRIWKQRKYRLKGRANRPPMPTRPQTYQCTPPYTPYCATATAKQSRRRPSAGVVKQMDKLNGVSVVA
ncbi:A49-like RNA polymerase I associated factor-domain-containing protein, partial [Mycena pura]